MWTFQYKNGDRPLDGFTIQRAAGRGGFGEVYYALSDSGREVALKAVQGYEQIELRGISQCMNLKSPHLVTIFDVKFNDQGRPFVIMEFVSGPSLRQLLDESPAGLGTQKAAFFLREIAKGLTFLHECGIVHRDLKPGNIFFENGYVKIGDYGLSKAISPTQHSGQTVTVGTVHYMAPEVGVGKYDRSIDIYAMGAVLYEMLTGTVPFIGASPSEILMKHLQAEPDMSGVPEPFNTVIRKAMAKNPADRYQNVQEMVEGVFGAEHVRMSVSCFSSEDLSMVAGRVAQKVTMGGGSSGAASGGTEGGPGTGGPGTGGAGIGGAGIGGGASSSVVGGIHDAVRPLRDPFGNIFGRLQDRRDEIRERLQDHADRMRERYTRLGIAVDPMVPPGPQEPTSGINDSLSVGSRWFLGLMTALVVAIASGLVLPNIRTRGGMSNPLAVDFFVFSAILGATVGLVVGWRKIAMPQLRQESASVRKLVVGLILSASMLLASGIFWMILLQVGHFPNGTLLAILAPLSFMNTWEWARANRKERVSLGPAIGIGIFGFILAGVFRGDPLLEIAVVCGTCLMVQVVSPWDPRLAASRRNFRTGDLSPDAPTQVSGNVDVTPQQAEATRTAGVNVYANLNVCGAPSGSATTQGPYGQTYVPPPTHRPVPAFAPYIWLGMFIVLFTIGLMCLIAVGTNAVDNSGQPPTIGFGISSILASVFCFVRIFNKRFYGWWRYLARPIFMWTCVTSILVSSIVMGNTRLDRGDALVAIFFIIFPSLLLLTLPFLPRRFGPPPLPKTQAGQDSPRSRGTALGCVLIGFFGVCGIQRFYVGKIGTGILWLVTGGFFGIGQIVDIIMICTGQFADAEGRVLRFWDVPGSVGSGRTASGSGAASPIPTPSAMASPDQSPVPAPTPAAVEGLADAMAQTIAHEMPAAPVPQWIPPIPTAPPVPAPTLVAPFRERPVSGGILSAITALLVLLLVVVSLAIGFDLPSAVANGLPDAQTAHEIRTALFPDSQMWATLVSQLLWIMLVVLATITLGMMMAARRQTAFLHILRGLLGIAGLLWAVSMLTSTFHKTENNWAQIAGLVNSHHTDTSMQIFASYFSDGHPLAAAGICLGSFLMLAIPYHRREAMPKEIA